MATDNRSKFYNLDDFLNKRIPDEIADKLLVAGRIEQFLRPTTTSAVSITSDPSIPKQDTTDIDKVNKEIDDLIDHVVEMENMVDQLEDMVDDHLKDMSIPPVSELIAKAAKSLGSDDGNITKNVLDQAELINDLAPMLLTGSDPIVMSLTGQGILDPNSGSFINCNEITKEWAKALKFVSNPNIKNAEIPITQMGSSIADAHDKSLSRMLQDIILKLFWNTIWSKFIVDYSIINPLRIMAANPIDKIMMFFKKACNVRAFKNKPNECIKNNGPLNKLLNKLRITLICFVPKKAYPRYENQSDVKCPNVEELCSAAKEDGEIDENEKELNKLRLVMEKLNLIECVTSNDLMGEGVQTIIKGPGLPPDCYNNAKIVVAAILENSLNPKATRKDSMGNQSNYSIIADSTTIV